MLMGLNRFRKDSLRHSETAGLFGYWIFKLTGQTCCSRDSDNGIVER
ncbi:MAG: hypothetical protein RL189_987 [Pseudomonadota bacterium]|jgi:hypothetical protein